MKKPQDCPKRPVIERMADVKPCPVEWLWPGRIPIGKLTLLIGDPGLGKSMLTVDLAARVSAGLPMPDCESQTSQAGDVILLNAEDDKADTIRPRLDAANGDPTRVFVLEGTRSPESQDGVNNSPAPFCIRHDLDSLELAIEERPRCRLVIVDPISAYIGGVDSHKDADVRHVLFPLATLAARHRVAIVAISHLNKGSGNAIQRAIGSIAFVAASRASLLFAKDPKDDDSRLLLPVKQNLGGRKCGLRCSIEEHAGCARLKWYSEPVRQTADGVLAAQAAAHSQAPALSEAINWLDRELTNGPQPATVIHERAREDGISSGTLKRAKRQMGIASVREEFAGPCKWQLPTHEA